MSSAVLPSSSADGLLELLVRELQPASDACLADKEQQEDDEQTRHGELRPPLGIIKLEPPSCSDEFASEPNSSSSSMASDHRERSAPFRSANATVNEPSSSRIVRSARTAAIAQASAPTVGLLPDANDSRQSERKNAAPNSAAGPTKRRRSKPVADRPVEAVCDICGQCFAKASHYALHRTIHTGEKPHECSVCGRRFRQLQSVKMHMMSHTGERPFSCEFCGQGHRTAGHLARHRLVHTGERPHACKVCPKKYYDAWTLHNHERSHTGERPFACKLCDKRFIRQNHLQRHEQRHLAAKKPFTCSVCGQSLASASSLKQHTARLHAAAPKDIDYCDECGDSFSTRYSLKVHMLRFHSTKSDESK